MRDTEKRKDGETKRWKKRETKRQRNEEEGDKPGEKGKLRRQRKGRRERQRSRPTVKGPRRREKAPSLSRAPNPALPPYRSRYEMGGTKKQQRQATSLGNLGDESQGDGHWEGHFGKEGGGRETSGLETSNRCRPRPTLTPHLTRR